MGMSTELTLNPVTVDAATHRALVEAGATILAMSDEGAPTEPEPRHGIHMTETGYVRVNVDAEGAVAEIGYGAFWALWQHEDLAYHHPHGGHAKFLELALLEGQEKAFALMAENVAAALEA
jgi:hypothetical protein